MKFIDLFCGIGGFRIALESFGHECVFSSEIDEYAKTSYTDNFKEMPNDDITKIKTWDIPEHDIVCAGFPCQSYSISGNKKGLNDKRGQLIWEVEKIAKVHKPKLILLENVKNILTIDNGKVLNKIKNRFEKIGYKFNYYLLNSSDFGIPQSRKRVYFVLIRNDLDWTSTRPKTISKEKYLKDILDRKYIGDLVINRLDTIIDKSEQKKAKRPIKIGYVNKGGQGERIYSANGHSITLSANGGGVGARTGLYLYWGKVRKLSQLECKKLMTFPATHKISKGIQGYKQLGNAVMPEMVKIIIKSIKMV